MFCKFIEKVMREAFKRSFKRKFEGALKMLSNKAFRVYLNEPLKELLFIKQDFKEKLK